MRPVPLLAALALSAVALSGCASQAMLAQDFSALTNEIQAAHAVTNCAPVDLAEADANFEFVKVEFDEGNTKRATEHLQIARQHAKVAAACAPVDAPKPVVQPKPEPVVRQAPTTTDTDGDSVADADDRCPRDPEDLDGFKDGDGCPDPDNDGDGVMDAADRCPMDVEDRDGFQDQDGCPDLDNDADGVPDAQDACPNDVGAMADRGCPVYDRDHDGVTDNQDRCPTEPETQNGYLDDDGCPDTKPQRVEVTADQIVIKQRINFQTGKAIILPDSFPVLDDVAQVMRDYPQIRVEIGGHTDNVGDDNVNQRLSKSRADAVFEYLLAKGIQATRMTTVGYGETRPLDTNMTEIGRNNNRRVEFVIQKDANTAPASSAPSAPAPSPWQ
jgi:outer membrane protein OmpA-like peptidoglycan-associated protein